MSRQTHYRAQVFEDTGFSESLCKYVLRDCDTTKDRNQVSCQNCIRKLHKLTQKAK